MRSAGKHGFGAPVVWAVLASALFVLAYRETATGRYERATVIGQTGYEVGRAPRDRQEAVIVRWVQSRRDRGVVIKEVLRDVLLYGSNDTWILVKRTNDRWAWIDWHAHRVREAASFDRMKARAPEGVVSLIDDLRRPRASYRLPFLCLGVGSLVIGVCMVVARLARRSAER